MYLYGVSSHKLCVCFLCANGSTDCIVLSISVHYTASRALCSGPHQGLIIGTYCFFARHLAFRSQSRGYALTSKQAQLQYACGPLGQRQCIAILAGCLPNPYSSLLSYLLLFTSAVLASQRFQNVLFSPVGRQLGSISICPRTTCL